MVVINCTTGCISFIHSIYVAMAMAMVYMAPEDKLIY